MNMYFECLNKLITTYIINIIFIKLLLIYLLINHRKTIYSKFYNFI